MDPDELFGGFVVAEISEAPPAVLGTYILESNMSMRDDGAADDVVVAVDDGHRQVKVPQVGMAFKSEEDAYDMYNSYAGKIGFSIRKSWTRRRKDDSIYQKHIVCSKQGEREKHSSHETVKGQATTRTKCGARIQFGVSRDRVWTVQKVVFEHNHSFVTLNKRHKMRSQRNMTEADKYIISQIREDGMKPAQVYDFCKQWYVGEENVPFTHMDCNNEIG